MSAAIVINGDNKYSEVNPHYRDRLIGECIHLVKHIAYRLAVRLPSHVSVNDLISAGMIGLLEAIDRFDYNRGVKIQTFVYIRIKGAMLDELRDMDWVSPSMRQKARQFREAYTTLEARLGRPPTEEETADALGVTTEKYQSVRINQGLAIISIEDICINQGEKKEDYLGCLQDTSESGPEVHTGFEEVKKLLTNSIDKLPENDKTVLSLYYYDELSLKEIGRVMGLTESRICQLHAQAIRNLKEQLRTERNDDSFILWNKTYAEEELVA
ncbi:MAG: FliA/WhiG family RNA polymerase sigma factor [Thermodesulfobacteriota bacterium]